MNRGLVHEVSGSYDLAIEDYTRAISLNPNLWSAYFGRGNSYYEKGDYDQALEDFNIAVSMNPDSTDANYQKAKTCEKTKQSKKAIESYCKFIEIALASDSVRIDEAMKKIKELEEN